MDTTNIDVAGIIGAVDRRIVNGERDGQPTRTSVATRTYDTSIDDLWDALTDEERIPRWFLPITGDLRLGGRYQLEGNAGGEILRCEAPSLLEVTWEYGGMVSWVTVRLSATADDATTLVLEHTAHIPDDLWAQFGPGATGIGWDLTLLGLGLHLTSAAPADPAAVDEWSASPSGRDFMARSGDDWCRASIAAGTPADEARPAAQRTLEAYTGVEPPSG